LRFLSGGISSTLATNPDLQVICEVADGMEAVEKAEELQPDLVLFDIGLPSLNGINAARQIRRCTPKSKVIFLTQESSADMVQEALSVGALAYVSETRAGRDLSPAVDAVLVGRKFVSDGLAGH
jgi:DNA-binding NarL/FixJ family response regulator